MRDFRLLSAAEQVAARLREEILKGNLIGTAPGVHRLAADFEVHRTTAEEALRLLGAEGLLMPQGAGRRRRIVLPKDFTPPSQRVRILHYQESDRTLSYVLDLQHRLMEAGHAVGFAPKNLLDLGMDVKRVARLVNETGADAWVVFSGTHEVLEWFADQPMPSFAMFGRRSGIRIAGIGPDKLPALLAAVRRLAALGHRKMVMLLREEQRKPQPGPFPRAFLDELESYGLSTSSYNLPDWEDSGVGLRRCLDSLFRITPPSALILDEAFLFNVAQHHLARRGVLAPKHVSLVCADPVPAFGWAHPSVAHIHWESRQVARRVVQWADNVARGKEDRRQTLTKAEFIEGGTIGPVRV
jgi:hypothetical protein